MNNSLKKKLIFYKKLEGVYFLWMVGTDGERERVSGKSELSARFDDYDNNLLTMYFAN